MNKRTMMNNVIPGLVKINSILFFMLRGDQDI